MFDLLRSRYKAEADDDLDGFDENAIAELVEKAKRGDEVVVVLNE